MVKTTTNGSGISPFLAKCYEIVDDESTDAVISWSQSNDSFVIWDMTEFCDLLPKYFKHQNFSSFLRQLNIYGFKKIDTDRWEFANEGFIKGQKHLLRNIKRRKHPQGSAQQKLPETETPVETLGEDYSGLKKEVEVLTADKKLLMQELIKLREHQETSQNNLSLLRERIQGMEKSQQQLLSFLVMVMQNPECLVQLFQSKETNWRMAESGKITLSEGLDSGEPVSSNDGVIVRYQPPLNERMSPRLSPLSNSGGNAEIDLSFDKVKELFADADIMSLPVDDSLPHGPVIVPEAPPQGPELDLSMIESFLLSSPIRYDNTTEESEDSLESEMEWGSCLYGTQLDKSQPTQQNPPLSRGECCQNLDMLTEEMGLLSSALSKSNEGVMK